MILPQFFQHLALLLLFLFFHPGLVDGQSKCVGSAPAAANPDNSPPRWKMTAAIQNYFFPLGHEFRVFFLFFGTTFSPLKEKAVQAFAQAPREVEVRWFRPALTFVWFLCVRVVVWREIHRASEVRAAAGVGANGPYLLGVFRPKDPKK